MGTQWSARNEQRNADEEIEEYLRLVQGSYVEHADAMLCGGDDTRVAELRDTSEATWAPRRIASVAIVSSWDWSSVVDGHGQGYRVRFTFVDGSTAVSDLAVEVIANDPCIATEVPF
jgi:hypothetical protein